jgi:hypothetical protein
MPSIGWLHRRKMSPPRIELTPTTDTSELEAMETGSKSVH